MADYVSALPVRTATAGDVVVKIVDSAGTNVATVNDDGSLIVRITDGTNNLAINADGSLSITIVADNVGLAKDRIDPTAPFAVRLSDGTAFIDPRDRNWNLSDATDSVTVKQAAGDVWKVSFVPEAVGTDVHEFYEHVDVGIGATSDYTYTVPTGKTFHLKQVLASASGPIKVMVLTGPAGSETVKAVAFSSAANKIANIVFERDINVAAGENVIIRVQNRGILPQSIYTTLVGWLE